MTVRPGFLLAAEGPLQAELSTGLATWECVRLSGYQFLPVDPRIVWVGAKLAIHGAEIDWDAQLGRGEGWKKAEIVGGRRMVRGVTANSPGANLVPASRDVAADA